MINKKGDMLTPAQLIIIILSVLGLVIALVIIFTLDLRGEADEKACSLSVLSRAGVGSALPSSTQSFVPLKCTTKKICITDGSKSECSQFKGESGVQYVVIDVKKNTPAEAARIIEKTNVEAKYNCWKTMGEGKLDIFPGNDASILDVFGKNWEVTMPTCFICYRIAISENLNKSKMSDKSSYFGKVQELVDINKYMMENAPEGSKESYLSLFTNKAIRSYGAADYTKGVPSQSALIFTQIITQGKISDKALGTGIATAGSIVILSKGKSVTSIPGLVITAGVSSLSGVLAGLAHWGSQEQSNIVCGPLTKGSENAREGCSSVGLYDYNDINKINSQCFKIEGNP